MTGVATVSGTMLEPGLEADAPAGPGLGLPKPCFYPTTDTHKILRSDDYGATWDDWLVAGGGGAVGDLTDVDLTGLGDNDGLFYDLASGLWKPAPVAGGISPALVDAKGDLLVGTADNTVGRRAVGSNGQVLTADSAEADGVKWATPGGGSGGEETYSVEGDGSTSITSASATLADMPGMSYSVPAAAGDVLIIEWWGDVAMATTIGTAQVCANIAGSDYRYGYQRCGEAGTIPYAFSYRARYVVQSGDISGGNVAVKMRFAKASGGTLTVFNETGATGRRPVFSVRNCG